MRIVAGPLAGVLRMSWRKFLLFNFLGAVVWVSVIASVGYFFGKHWEGLVDLVEDANIAIAVVVIAFAAFSGGGEGGKKAVACFSAYSAFPLRPLRLSGLKAFNRRERKETKVAARGPWSRGYFPHQVRRPKLIGARPTRMLTSRQRNPYMADSATTAGMRSAFSSVEIPEVWKRFLLACWDWSWLSRPRFFPPWRANRAVCGPP